VLIDTGSIQIEQDGRVLRTLGAGAGVGEIALLEDVPRTASVRAVGPVEAFALERAAFLEAITGHRAAHEQATASARRTLAGEP
jgi:CRP-like cAMP-binding protein